MEKLEWSALEYEEKERGNDWFWALGVIVVAGSAASFIYGNYFFSIFLIVAGVLLGSFAIKKPDVVDYELNEKGLKIRNRLFPYKEITSFWVKNEESNPTLFIKSKRAFMPIFSVPIEQHMSEKIKQIMLSAGALEEEMKEHPSEKIMESLGF